MCQQTQASGISCILAIFATAMSAIFDAHHRVGVELTGKRGYARALLR